MVRCDASLIFCCCCFSLYTSLLAVRSQRRWCGAVEYGRSGDMVRGTRFCVETRASSRVGIATIDLSRGRRPSPGEQRRGWATAHRERQARGAQGEAGGQGGQQQVSLCHQSQTRILAGLAARSDAARSRNAVVMTTSPTSDAPPSPTPLPMSPVAITDQAVR